MPTIRHINEEEYAAKALELLNHRREGYVNYALSLLKQSMSQGQASEKLEDKVKEDMETVLFEYLKHRGYLGYLGCHLECHYIISLYLTLNLTFLHLNLTLQVTPLLTKI